jgi:cation diffusion facilitator CzcD-associated flavoprotein CzcO
MTGAAARAGDRVVAHDDDRRDRWCIIGAGPSGLASARAFARAGIPFDVLERGDDVGGIWNIEATDSPMYESAHFISSKTQSAFDGFPMPASYPDYPSWRQIHEYLRAFADACGLRPRMEFGVTVEHVAPFGDDDASWRVVLAGGAARRYRGIVLATGHNWDPILPSYPGTFTGEAYHSMRYRSPEAFRGKRVLVVGGGNSGCDIACDAAVWSDRATISLRRGYRFLPKHIFGQPTDVFFRHGPEPPLWIAQPLLALLLRLLVGNVTRFGLPKPDHKVLQSHPIMNTQILHHLAHGAMHVKPDVMELRGTRVAFIDGSEEAFDVIVWATGYHASFPVLGDLTREVLAPGTLYLNLIPARVPNLYLIGHFESDGGAYPLVSRQGELVARLISAPRDPRVARWREALLRSAPPDLSGGITRLATERHSYYVQFDECKHYLDKALKAIGSGQQPVIRT